MLILKTLSLEPMHGFGIARRVEQISRGVSKVNPGSLLTALTRLERAGCHRALIDRGSDPLVAERGAAEGLLRGGEVRV